MEKQSITAPWNHDKPELDAHHLYRGYPAEIKSLLRYVRSGSQGLPLHERTKFVIFGGARSGSSLLVNLLNQQDSISCLGEILRCKLLFAKAHRNRCLAMTTGQICGFKLLTYQITQVIGSAPNERYLDKMCSEGFKVVYVSRENKLRMAISNMYARLEGQFHNRVGAERVASTKYHFPPEELVLWIEGAEKRREEEIQMLKGIDHMPVSYERDLENTDSQQLAIDRVCKWLGTTAKSTEQQLKPVTPRSLDTVIKNYDEIVDMLDSRGLSHYLAETSNS